MTFTFWKGKTCKLSKSNDTHNSWLAGNFTHLVLYRQFNTSFEARSEALKCSPRTRMKWPLIHSHLSLLLEIPVAALLPKSHTPSSLFLKFDLCPFGTWRSERRGEHPLCFPSLLSPPPPPPLPVLSPHLTHGTQGRWERVTQLKRMASSVSIGEDRWCVNIRLFTQSKFNFSTGIYKLSDGWRQ